MLFAFVFDVDVHVARAVGGGEFGLAVERDGSRDGSGGGVNGGGVFAAAVHGEDALGSGIVNDGVGIRAGLRAADDLQRLQIEDGDGAGASVGGEAAAEFGSERDAVDALGVGDFADNFAGVHVEDDDFCRARNKQAARGRIEVQVIPEAFAAERDFLQQMIAGRPERGGRIRLRLDQRDSNNGCCKAECDKDCEETGTLD